MSKIEDFAYAKYGIRLTLIQVKMLEAWSLGKTITVPKRCGQTYARRVYYAYLRDGMKQKAIYE
jgi:hypothetical protein